MSILRTVANNQIRVIQRFGARHQSQLVKSEFESQRNAVKVHAAESAETWKKISIFVCIPALLAAGFNAYKLYADHHEHMQHHPREWVKYPYINYRCKDYFWGKNSLFFNPHTNLDATQED